ncbi:MAG: hypothetical protein IBX44_03670 [Sulfurospirillum sp.]|nr:hypothetical protein [Sulfurospirillum sp.]
MKHLCCSKFLTLLLFLTTSLLASLGDKSAIIYYAKNISYPMVGIHDYIVINPENTNTKTHGFSVYRHKIYARISVNVNELEKITQKQMQEGYENFFLDIQESAADKKELVKFIKSFHEQYPHNKLIVNGKFDIFDAVSSYINAVIFDVEMDTKSRKQKIKKAKSLGLDVIQIEYAPIMQNETTQANINEAIHAGVIPYVTNHTFDNYGISSKNAIKREVFTLIDESIHDRSVLSAHQHGAVVFEYLGYIQKLYDVNKGLPDIDGMKHYAGVVIWLSRDYESPKKLIEWVLALQKEGIKVAFASSFGLNVDGILLKQLGIDMYDGDTAISNKKTIIQRDEMIGFEIEPSLSAQSIYLNPSNSKALLTYEDTNKLRSVPSAITPWGGYAIAESFMLELNDENIWIIDPFKFFAEALRLEKLPVPDVTTQNGNRLLFTHIDGDGIMNYVESNPNRFSGDMILEEILKPYKIPHSVSIIGAEVMNEGLYPEISDKLITLTQKMYSLENVEAATHTFTHPFIWSKIKNGNLDEKYRLKVKNYNFSLHNELGGSLAYINQELVRNDKRKAKTVFWSGDCAPMEDVLEYTYKNNILNINGGYTVISNANPWLTNVSPLGLERGEYYQIYTGARNENIYTNYWFGPFWGFKKVVQTFQLTNSPRRYKPINVNYHHYSGSKTGSLNALKYIFDWALQQDVMPIFTSEYIPKVMDFYTVSMARENDSWFVEGMRDLKTLRIEEQNAGVDLDKSSSALGLKHFENHTYISLDNSVKHTIKIDKSESYNKRSYLVSSNAKAIEHTYAPKNQTISFEGHVDLKLSFYLPQACTLDVTPKSYKTLVSGNNISFEFTNTKKAVVHALCR